MAQQFRSAKQEKKMQFTKEQYADAARATRGDAARAAIKASVPTLTADQITTIKGIVRDMMSNDGGNGYSRDQIQHIAIYLATRA